MNAKTYSQIKSRIKRNVTLNNGYQFDDLCHDTILILLEKNKPDEDCLKMCTKIALNLIRSHHRKCQKVKFEKLYESSCNVKYPEIEKIEITKPAIKGNRLIYELRYGFDMKYKEIADYLEMPIGTVKARVHKMHNELKELNQS